MQNNTIPFEQSINDSKKKYQDLLGYVKEIVQLRASLMTTNPDQKQLNVYKLLTKCFGAYYRIKDDPQIFPDSITKDDNTYPAAKYTTSYSTATTTENLPKYTTSYSTTTTENLPKNTSQYLFGDNDDDDKIVHKDDTTDDDKEIEQLFLSDQERETLPDDKDVSKMFQMSEIKLNRAILGKSYVVTEDIQSDSDSTQKIFSVNTNEKKELHTQTQVQTQTQTNIETTMVLVNSEDKLNEQLGFSNTLEKKYDMIDEGDDTFYDYDDSEVKGMLKTDGYYSGRESDDDNYFSKVSSRKDFADTYVSKYDNYIS